VLLAGVGAAPESFAPFERMMTQVLKEIRLHNPLLFDFVLKRHLHLGAKSLSTRIFETRKFFA
jgi:hypothetical protein